MIAFNLSSSVTPRALSLCTQLSISKQTSKTTSKLSPPQNPQNHITMDRTINMALTPDEKKLILADRQKKAREELKKKRNEEAVVNQGHFKIAIQALKTSKTVLIDELKKHEVDNYAHHGPQSYFNIRKSGKALEKLLDVLLHGLALVEEISKDGITSRSQLPFTGGSKTLLAGCNRVSSYLGDKLEQVMREMKDVLEGKKAESKTKVDSDSDSDYLNNKKRKL